MCLILHREQVFYCCLLHLKKYEILLMCVCPRIQALSSFNPAQSVASLHSQLSRLNFNLLHFQTNRPLACVHAPDTVSSGSHHSINELLKRIELSWFQRTMHSSIHLVLTFTDFHLRCVFQCNTLHASLLDFISLLLSHVLLHDFWVCSPSLSLIKPHSMFFLPSLLMKISTHCDQSHVDLCGDPLETLLIWHPSQLLTALCFVTVQFRPL